MGKVEGNKQLKLSLLLESAKELFIERGMSKTSVADITAHSGVAKGTFYLYFKDKYDIRNKLVAYESARIFSNAYRSLPAESDMSIEDKIIYIVDNAIDQLNDNLKLMALISKNLSWAVLKKEITKPQLGEDSDISVPFHNLTSQAGLDRKDSEIMLFLIIELAGSACYSSMLFSEPCPIDEFKPILYRSLRDIIREFIPKSETV